ncbi:TrkA family potassium uptake protein [Natrinema hispanicum]|uniref:Trk K+ transport system, NAD-binding component n=1 Tax=Natrinema hispanicum TaxID=392421 RepID=A0A1G6JHF8_9EURY|nr:NAD-binding protein [Natrinema hispanicum]SDC18160.1 Trk K+ transport system, NAD-binding component [Natrinema hispanicum]SES66764.1 Trk K+ transport system, NAD-binding component [Natrinema hispanicum]
MNYWWRRIALSLVAVFVLVFVYAGIYQAGMAAFEGVDMSYFEALQFVIEALTTAGFGGDSADWQSVPTNLMVIGMNLTGVLLVFLALPLLVVPLFQQALEDRPPESTNLTDHVVICSYTPRSDVLAEELEAANVPYVFIDDDPELVVELDRDGIDAIYGELDQAETLRAANATDARALVTDIDDETNAMVILTARELSSELRIVSVVEDADVASYHRYAGADEIVRPRRVLGQSLATKATTAVSTELRDTIELSEDFTVTELLVQAHSDLVGQTIPESGIRDRMGITVIGAWFNGEFVPVPGPDDVIDDNTILLVAGRRDDLTELKSRTVSTLQRRPERVVVGGYGVVGQAAVETLADEGITTFTIDTVDADGVDIVGSVTDESVLETAGVTDGRSVVLTLDDDAASIYATLVIKQIAPSIEIIVRANETENIPKFYRAGAEYVLSLSTVTGRMLASVLIEDEEVLTPETQFELVRTAAPELVGRSLGDVDLRARTGCTVVAVERGDELLTDLGPGFVVRADDTLIVAGSDEAINQFVAVAT